MNSAAAWGSNHVNHCTALPHVTQLSCFPNTSSNTVSLYFSTPSYSENKLPGVRLNDEES